MRCKKCGFVLEEGQTFCNMCGAEQSKIKERTKTEVRSLFGFIKFNSKNHRKMWFNFLIGLILLVYTVFFDVFNMVREIDVSAVSILTLFLIFIFVQIIAGYKNPEATHTKRYKYIIKLSLLVYLVLVFYLLVINDAPHLMVEFWKKLFNWNK